MSLVFILSLLYMLSNLSRTFKINKTERNLHDRNEINNHIVNRFPVYKKYNYFYFINNTKVHLNLNRLFSKLNNPNRNTAIIENYKNNGTELLFTKLLINNQEAKFLIDLCSDKSFIFEKQESIFNRKNILEEDYQKKRKTNIENYMKTQYMNNDELLFKFDDSWTKESDDVLYLNSKKIKAKKIINIQNENKIFPFYQISNEELSKNFDGIIGFDFFKAFNNFYIDFQKKVIKFNQEHDYIDIKKFYEIKLYDYENNLKYININIDGQLYKGIFDTANRFTIINSEKHITDQDATIENILKEKFKVKKKSISNFYFISNENELIKINLKNVFVTNFHFLHKNVVLIGLDILQDKNLFFDVKKNVLYISKENERSHRDLVTESETDTDTDTDTDIGKKYEGKEKMEREQSLMSGIKKENYTEKMKKETEMDAELGTKLGVKENLGMKEKINEGEKEKVEGEIKIDDKLIERESRKIFEQLKNKELNFLKITKDMEKENIYLKDCKSTNDIIKRYAIKLLYGSKFLKKNNENEKGEEFEIRYNEITNFFKKLSNEEKQNMLNKIINIMKKNKEHYEKASEILEEYVNFEINKNIYSLHKFKSSNVGKNNEKAFNDEYNNLFNYYNNHPDFSFEILNDFKKELTTKKINFDKFNDEQEIIKKIAESRVYNYNSSSSSGKDLKKNRGMKRNIIVRRYSNDDNNIHTQIIIRRNTLEGGDNDDGEEGVGETREQNENYNNVNRMEELFPNSLFSGIFRNFFGEDRTRDNSMSTDDITDQTSEQLEEVEEGGAETDLFSELNNLFGFGNFGGNMFRKKKKSVLGFKTKESQGKIEQKEKKEEMETIENAIKEETDVDVIYLLNKVNKLNDVNLKNFILQSLKNENIRKILLDAIKNGYAKTMEECKKENDNKGIYLLQKLKQSGIF